jgi:membrane-bound lytic murein transglycosylase D
MRTGYADYWELYRRNALPQETKNYVPGIIAAIIMAKNPKQYGLEGLVPDPPVVSDTVSVDYPVDLRLVADVTEASLGEIVALNPSLLHMSTPRDTNFDLHLPAGTRDVYLKRIKDIPEDKRTSWRFHVVKTGESLDSIASNFHDRTSEIAAANDFSSTDSVEAGDELIVPVSIATAIPHPLHYVTRAGDTLVTVADRFDVSVEDLRRWNHLSSSRISPRRTLFVSQPVRLAPVTHVRAKRSHTASSAPVARSASSGKSSAKAPTHAAASRKSVGSKHRVAAR